MRRRRSSAGIPDRSCQYFRGYGSSYVCDLITRGIRGRMITAVMPRRHRQDVAARLQTSFACVSTRCVWAHNVSAACLQRRKACGSKQGHFAKYMAPGHGVRKIYSSRGCAIKRAIKVRRVTRRYPRRFGYGMLKQ